MHVDIYHPATASDNCATSLELPAIIARHFEAALIDGRTASCGTGLRHPDTGADVSLLMFEVGYQDRYDFAVLERVETVELVLSIPPTSPPRAFVRCWRA